MDQPAPYAPNPRLQPSPPRAHPVKNFVWGFICGLIVVGVVCIVLLWCGAINFAASKEEGALEKTFAPWALNHSVMRRAPNATNPMAKNASARVEGLAHFAADCVICHGAPEVSAGDPGMGLNPPAPPLDTRHVQAFTDGQLFYIVKNGIRWSGMPAFGDSRSDEDIWKIVSFVRDLRHLTPDEKAKLKKPGEEHASAERSSGLSFSELNK